MRSRRPSEPLYGTAQSGIPGTNRCYRESKSRIRRELSAGQEGYYEIAADRWLPMRETITEEPQTVYTCHCTACQRLTSSAFSMGLVVAETAFRLSGVEPKPLQRVADSGRVNTRLVCPECGSWICGLPRDGLVRVRAGSLDDTSWLRPTRHIWTRSKQPWITFAPGDEIFEAQPPA
jgi:hypothetical protein